MDAQQQAELREGLVAGFSRVTQESQSRMESQIRRSRDWMIEDGTMKEMINKNEREREDKAQKVNTPWPTLAQEARYGLAGDFVSAIEPHTESDPVAILIQILTSFGNVIGKGPHFLAEAAVHSMNLFSVLVGDTSKGRKGTSQSNCKRVFEAVESEWSSKRVLSGLSSGEGLIWAVRDPIYKTEAIKDRQHRVVDYQEVQIDSGVSDKRLLVFESEFASTLKVMSREGNTLSATMRQAWDGEDLRIMTKNSPGHSTGSHISVMGHITRDELLRNLDSTEAANGFANRFLWVCVRRSKFLPDGGEIHKVDFEPLHRRLSAAIEKARSVKAIRRNETARQIWCAVYPSLSGGKPGLLGAVVSRAEAQVMRLACLYALLDGETVVRPDHLNAALALWAYCEESVRYIFGKSLGDPVADEILRALRAAASKGLTRTEIRDLFSRHQTNKVSAALDWLESQGMIAKRDEETGGRTAERWFLCGYEPQ
jgi:hypothetical protein